MTVSYEIIFENKSNDVFYSGDVIFGTVHLKLTERKKLRGVYVSFNGDSRTNWSEYVEEERGYGDDRHYERVLRQYCGHENHLSSKIYLVREQGDSFYLDAGQYTYNFEFQLPHDLPSSFEGEHGDIRYNAKLVLIVPWWFNDTYKKPFTVIKTLDLNAKPSLHRPVIIGKKHTFKPCYIFCCCPSGPLKVIAQLPVGGYVPGQTINLTFTVENESGNRVEHFKVELIKNIEYYAEGKYKFETISKATGISTQAVEVNQKRIINMDLKVPSCLPTAKTYHITISYYIEIKCYTDAIGGKLKTIVPITIGTEPIVENMPIQHNSSCVVTYQPAASQVHPTPMNNNGENCNEIYMEKCINYAPNVTLLHLNYQHYQLHRSTDWDHQLHQFMYRYHQLYQPMSQYHQLQKCTITVQYHMRNIDRFSRDFKGHISTKIPKHHRKDQKEHRQLQNSRKMKETK
ncbi:arrestin domain-containing protein 3-like isoform X2 [Contarinia nasturtii]|uniref:arrestin domain-containing protein 3-like isoform X2 n=1 Tax=Contarinia nasturtii TaxID=265458 RepID=UPI0012D3E3E9|nr:arrestin domain-containing protein 3-like isoform X2 [Contarinia nasturtii]